MINEFDKKALDTINNLCKTFNTSYTKRDDLISPYSVGIEIEIKFKAFFPELSKQYLTGVRYWELSEDTKSEFIKLIDVAEIDIKANLEKTVECGIHKGTDRYWEFAFTPVYNLALLVQQIEILRTIGLMPKGTHSLHISIGNLEATPNVYYILMALELLYAKKERIIEGYSKDKTSYATWSKKGYGGIYAKNEYDLVNSNVGFEFRTLCIYDDTDIYQLFKTLNYFLNSKDNMIIDCIKSKMIEYGLPHKNWKKPYLEPQIWDTYIEVFNDFSDYAKKIILDKI